MTIKNETRCLEYAWLVPFTYGALLCAASLAWLVSGLPFDHVTYERIAGIQWNEIIKSLDPRTMRVIGAIVRELGGNTGLVAGTLIIVTSAVLIGSAKDIFLKVRYKYWGDLPASLEVHRPRGKN